MESDSDSDTESESNDFIDDNTYEEFKRLMPDPRAQSRESLYFEALCCGGKFQFACNKIKEFKNILDIPEHIKTVYLESIDLNQECPICFDQLQRKDNITLTNCGHILCNHCFSELIQRKMCKCPICNNPNMIIEKKKWRKQETKCMKDVLTSEGIPEEEIWNRPFDEYGFVNSDRDSDYDA